METINEEGKSYGPDAAAGGTAREYELHWADISTSTGRMRTALVCADSAAAGFTHLNDSTRALATRFWPDEAQTPEREWVFRRARLGVLKRGRWPALAGGEIAQAGLPRSRKGTA